MKLNKNKRFALYLLWFFLNLILFLTSGNFLTRYDSNLFPFPLYKTTTLDTYHYTIYNKLGEWYNGVPSFEEFINQCKTENDRLHKIWTRANKVGYFIGDSTSFYNSIKESIKRYGTDKTYTKYRYFTSRLDDYDYSEFIIYLMFPVIIYYFKRFWFAKKEINSI